MGGYFTYDIFVLQVIFNVLGGSLYECLKMDLHI